PPPPPPPPPHHLHTRYTLDGEESRVPWENFQLDGYGAWLWALVEHARRHDRPCPDIVEGATLSARYIAACWDEASYDWWEEHATHRHTSTMASIYGGLAAVRDWDAIDGETRGRADAQARRIRSVVADLGVCNGRLTKWFGSTEVDASLVACATPFRLYEPGDPTMQATIERIEGDLVSGGVHRYLDDTYYGGGEWVLLAGFLGWHHAENGAADRAGALLRWIVGQADAQGDLPEQAAQHLLHPERKAEWDERWGPSARPLLWSHAMLLTLVSVLESVPRTESPQEVSR
ncbi:MAG: glycoside hydrolase family 15 protein, partial [Nitriliruptoraceae bacterium]